MMFILNKNKVKLLSLIILSSLILSPTKNNKEIEILAEELAYMGAIKKINPRVPASTAQDLSKSLIKLHRQHKIDPKLVLAILQTESSLDNSMISYTGDYSIAQINLKIWNKELKRLGKEELNENLLKTDSDYAVMKMGEILSIIKSRYPNDPNWYARYHSNTPKLKMKYQYKVNKTYKQIAESY